MSNNFDPFKPTVTDWVGKVEKLDDLASTAVDRRCLLLFGGRQSGKTSLLLKLQESMQREFSITSLGTYICPVFVDLTSLPASATPTEFFNMLIDAALAACDRDINGFSINIEADRECSSVERFAAQIQNVTGNTGEVDLTLLFLIDEAERVLGERFPRGFQDNLFSVLYGPELAAKTKIAIIFAGAQGLYKFSEDDTSPIGSRAGYRYMEGILASGVDYFDQLNKNYSILIPLALQERILSLTGGHAGLTARLSSFVNSNKITTALELDKELPRFQLDCRQLLRLWATSLSIQARAIHDELCRKNSLLRSQLFAIFNSHSWDPIFVEKAIDELLFTGLATDRNKILTLTNPVYWDYIREFIVEAPTSIGGNASPSLIAPAGYDEIWNLIERAEIALRSYVNSVYTSAFGTNVEAKIRLAVGDKAMTKILSNVTKSNARYKYSEREEVLGIFDGLYLGQLCQLMISKEAWSNFSRFTNDKRELELLLQPITSVRTDKAHFYKVPLREVIRCKLHCEDLIGLIEKNMPKGAV